jgi:lysozyme
MNDKGCRILKRAEGLLGTDGAPALEAYLDSAHIATIGWGHTKGVAMGQQITVQQAEDLFGGDKAPAEDAVSMAVKKPLTDNQFAALVIFVFNVGIGAFKGSTLLKVLNAGRFEDVPAAMAIWNKAHVNGQLVVLKGLTNRRQIEIDLWNTP